MSTPNASAAGRFKLGGVIEVARLGYGAMRIAESGVEGVTPDREASLRALRRLPELGVEFIDTADAYGPFLSENLIAEVLAPYPKMVIATKGGLTRPEPNVRRPNGRPEYLRQCVQGSLARLGVERIDLWQLHRIDPTVPREEQFGVIADMIKEGLIRLAGLSEVSVEQAEAANAYFPVASVQNRYNVADRGSEAVLQWCEARGVGFIPWFPLAAGKLAQPGGVLDTIANKLGASQSQVALAWVLKRSPVILPIPGTINVAHLEQNVAAAALHLPDEDFAALDTAGKVG